MHKIFKLKLNFEIMVAWNFRSNKEINKQEISCLQA